MFFMMGITSGRKDFDFRQMEVCLRCRQYGSYHVFMTYTVLSLFFIPVFRWNRKYYVTTSCCKTTYLLDPEIGRMIAGGESPKILPEHLTQVAGQGSYGGWYSDRYKNDEDENNSYTLVVTRRCSHCGFTTEEDFDYCPKCGNKL